MNFLSGFKVFLEKSDLQPEKADYFASLGDEEGLDWGNLVKALEAEPWVASHFGLGAPEKEILYKLSPWEIVKGSLTPEGADIRLKPQRNSRSYLSNNRLNKSSYEDKKRYHLNRQELVKFLTTGWTPAVQASGAGAGAGAGLPPIS